MSIGENKSIRKFDRVSKNTYNMTFPVAVIIMLSTKSQESFMFTELD